MKWENVKMLIKCQDFLFVVALTVLASRVMQRLQLACFFSCAKIDACCLFNCGNCCHGKHSEDCTHCTVNTVHTAIRSSKTLNTWMTYQQVIQQTAMFLSCPHDNIALPVQMCKCIYCTTKWSTFSLDHTKEIDSVPIHGSSCVLFSCVCVFNLIFFLFLHIKAIRMYCPPWVSVISSKGRATGN